MTLIFLNVILPSWCANQRHGNAVHSPLQEGEIEQYDGDMTVIFSSPSCVEALW